MYNFDFIANPNDSAALGFAEGWLSGMPRNPRFPYLSYLFCGWRGARYTKHIQSPNGRHRSLLERIFLARAVANELKASGMCAGMDLQAIAAIRKLRRQSEA
jgi:hypothetical protein